ncbi:MAG: hypothetical protein ICV68_17750 [Pyrinomonadaceae bacterium]|nr:hypothetical protein [Pyrinomonadaceae bacterium]
MSEHFIPFEGGASTTAGKLLALNPSSVSAIYSEWDKRSKQNTLCILLNSRQVIRVLEEDAPGALEDLGLGELANNWVLNLETDIG